MSLGTESSYSFTEWTHSHKKVYPTVDEMERRRAAFYENAVLISKLNSEGDGAVYDLSGPWSDLIVDEFRKKVLMPPRGVPSALSEARELRGHQTASLPDSFDWSTQGAVTAVRDQGALGSCWALSTAENVEGQYARATGKLVELAPQQLIECDSNVDLTCGGKGANHSTLGCADCGMFGGWPYLAYQFLQRVGGMFLEAEWPYQHDGVFPCMPDGYDKRQCGNHDDLFCRQNSTKGQGPHGMCHASSGFTARVTGWKALSENETELAAQLMQYGPLSVLLEADGLQNYHSGIWKGGLFGCKPDPVQGVLGLDHAVLLVGYGAEKDLFGKETPYWKLKNSWGTKWGEQGFFRLLRGSGICGINLAATTAEVQSATPDEIIV